MKRIISILFAVLSLSVIASAQDSRGRTLETIAQDVLAALPASNYEEFNTNMQDLAKSAPASVIYLASMMQPAEAGQNNLLEYAISGVVRYATDPENKEYKTQVKDGLQSAISACKDEVSKSFLESQLRLMLPFENGFDAEVSQKYTSEAALKAVKKGKETYDQCSVLWALVDNLGEKSQKKILSALKNDERDVRTTALLAYEELADDAFYEKLAKLYGKLSEEAKADVIYWFGEKNVKSQIDLVLSELQAGGELGENAIEAAGKMGGEKAAEKLLGLVGGDYSADAIDALKYIDVDFTSLLLDELKVAEGEKLFGLMTLSSERRVVEAAQIVIANSSSSDKELASKAASSLAGVVSPSDFSAVAAIYDKASSDEKAFRNALESSMSSLSASEKYEKVLACIGAASNPEKFYSVLAKTGADEAVDYLMPKYEGGSDAAFNALVTIESVKVLPVLLDAADKNQNYLKRYADIVLNKVKNDIDKCLKLESALEKAEDVKIADHILSALGKLSEPKAFSIAGSYLDNKKSAKAAAKAVKNIASKSAEEIDYFELKEVLEKAADVLRTTGNADDGYAVDEIVKILESVKPYELSKLSDEEKAQGFEMLFDGSDLSKWTGDTLGYTVANGCINVTAGYGNSKNLYTIKEYGDFVLRFEFCFTREGVNNGVGIRTPMGVDAAYHGMEIQVLDHDAPIYANLKEYQVHGSVYGIIPAERIVHKPLGEWSYEEIRAVGDRITVTVNGKVILDGNIREACQGNNVSPDGTKLNPYTVDKKNHPGLFNSKGHIGFLGHGKGMKYRNVRVLDLSK